MREDDEIIEDYERELEEVVRPRRRSATWLEPRLLDRARHDRGRERDIVVEIFANRPIADTIGRAQHDLRVGEAQARSVLVATGGFTDADAAALEAARLDDGSLDVVGPDEVSSGLGEISVYADATTWAAAVSVRPRPAST